MALITVDGVALSNPTSYKVTWSDLDSDNTKRTETGVLRRSRVRANVYKIDISWTAITKAQLKIITDALSPEKFSVMFFDPTQSITTTTDMYASDRTGALSRNMDESRPDQSYWDLTVSLIEF